MILGKEGVKIVSGYTEVIARVIPECNTGRKESVGVRSFFPVYIKIVWGYTLSCLLITGNQEYRGTLFPFPVYIKMHSREHFSVGVHGTLSCLLITGSQECKGTLFLSSVY